jgi:hypothetical protein
VSDGKETQGWRDSSNTAIVGAGKFGSVKLPMATATYPGNPSPEARLVADHGASAALALQAVAHGDARWLALNRDVKLPAVAGGMSGGHDERIWAEYRLDFKTMHR